MNTLGNAMDKSRLKTGAIYPSQKLQSWARRVFRPTFLPSATVAMENPNVVRFTGFADIYDQYRPKPPEIIADLLLQLAGTDRANHVVDLGCGTGLSTLIWTNRTNLFADLLKHGYTEAEVGLDRLRETVQLRFGDRTMRWFWCYRIRLGIR